METVEINEPRVRGQEKQQFADPFGNNVDDMAKFAGLAQQQRRKVNRLVKEQGEAKSKALIPLQNAYTGYGLFDVMQPPYNLDELAWYYESSFPNRRAVKAKAFNYVGLGYDFVLSPLATNRLESASSATAQQKARKRIDALKVQLKQWLDGLNDSDTFTDVLIKACIDAEATGNGYIEIGRTTQGRIGYIGHVPASTVRVRRLKDGYVQIIGRDVVFFKNFQSSLARNPVTSDSRPNELIHIKVYSPRSSYYGVPDIISAIESMVGNSLSGRYNIDYFENKAVPRYIAVLKGAQLSATSEERLYNFLQAGLRGQNHRTLLLPLPADSPESKVEFKLEPVENGIQDASFEKYRKSNKNDIFIAHGVPASRVGGEATQNIAASLAADRAFKEQVVRPMQRSLEKQINKIVAEATDVLEFRFNELSLTDENTQSQIDERYLRMQVYVPNEVRERQGMPSRIGGEQPVKLSAQQAADQRGEANANRQRDQQRTANATDGPNTDTGRNPKGEGRAQQ